MATKGKILHVAFLHTKTTHENQQSIFVLREVVAQLFLIFTLWTDFCV